MAQGTKTMSAPYVILRSGAEVRTLISLARQARIDMTTRIWKEDLGIVMVAANPEAGIGVWFYLRQNGLEQPYLGYLSGPSHFSMVTEANRPTILTNSPAHLISYIRAARARSQSAAAVYAATVRPI